MTDHIDPVAATAAIESSYRKYLLTTMRTNDPAINEAITRGFEAEVWPKLIDGRLRPIIDIAFPIAEAQAAHEYVREDRNIGKVILEMP